MSVTKSYFCPSCGGADLQSQALIGGDSNCNTCHWTGPTTELIVHVFNQDLGSDEEIARAIASEYKLLIGRHLATPLAAFLAKWGFFLGPQPTPQELTRYIVAMAKSSLNSMLEVRREIEKERVNAGN